MKTVHDTVQDILDERKSTLTESSYISERRGYLQLLKTADGMGISIPCQKLFDTFVADDHGYRSRRLKHTMVLKRLDLETGLHAVRLDLRPYNPLPLPSLEETETFLANMSFPLTQGIDIGYIIVRAESELHSMGHRPMSIDDDYADSMRTIHCFFLNNGYKDYDASCMEAFLVRNDLLFKEGQIQRNRWYNDRKAGYILMETAATGHYFWKRISSAQSVISDAELESIRQQYIMDLKSDNLSDATVRNLSGAFREIINSAEIESVEELKNLSVEAVQQITTQLSKNNAAASLRTMYGRVRSTLRYFYEEGFTSHNRAACVLTPAVVRNNVAGYFSKKDEAKLYGNLDAVSLRDKAICLIAANLGLRDYDICHLMFDQIDWSADRIRIVQHKNNEPLVLPLDRDIGNALMDYILNERPKLAEPIPYVFLTSVAPFRPLQHAYYPCRNLIELSGIVPVQGKHKGSHLYRDNLVHRLLENKVPHQVITDTLGHRSVESDKSYVTMEPEMLRQCALGLGLIGACYWKEGGPHV